MGINFLFLKMHLPSLTLNCLNYSLVTR